MEQLDIKQHTREEWRELGFYYDFDDETMQWKFIGSKTGLSSFVDLLRNYASNPRNNVLFEHDHYGPYMFLKILTYSEAGVNEHAIFGTPTDLQRLADIIEQKIIENGVSEIFIIGEEYTPDIEAVMVFDIKEESYDPASSDPLLINEKEIS